MTLVVRHVVVYYVVQDVLLLLDLIGSADTQFVNWFSKTQLLYNRLKDIGTGLLIIFRSFRMYN